MWFEFVRKFASFLVKHKMWHLPPSSLIFFAPLHFKKYWEKKSLRGGKSWKSFASVKIHSDINDIDMTVNGDCHNLSIFFLSRFYVL